MKHDRDLEGAIFKIGDKTLRAVKTDLVFRTPLGDSEMDLTLFKVGADLIPMFYLRDPDITRRWLDYCLREGIRAYAEIKSIDLLTAGRVLTAEEAASTPAEHPEGLTACADHSEVHGDEAPQQ